MMRRPFEAPDETAWGKSRGLDLAYPPYPLVRHLLDAAAMALCLWDHYLSDNQRRCIAVGLGLAEVPEEARSIAALCAGLHDIGKLSGFQFCDARGGGLLSGSLAEDRGKIGVERLSHDVAGLECTPAVLAALGFEDKGDVVARVAEIVGGHHGEFFRFEQMRIGNSAYQEQLGGPSWARQREAHAAAVFAVLGEPGEPERFEAPAAVLVTGMVILADWLVSQEDYLRRRQRHMDLSLQRHFEQSCTDAEALVRAAGLLPVELNRKPFAEAYGIDGKANPLQQSVTEELSAAVNGRCSDRCKAGILLVTAAPGDGKTETALEAEGVMSAAFGTRGFAFLLPTMATSDQMHSRIAGVLHRQDGQGGGLTLTHSMAWLSKAYADDDLDAGTQVLVGDGEESGRNRASRRRAQHNAAMRPARWLRGHKRPLLAQYTVGTVDQALMAVLPVRHNALRLMALSGKTFIVDEAHAYDPYMQVLLGRLLNWLGAYGVPVILLSATLPASVSDKLIKEYLRGAGLEASKRARRSFAAPYPGWVYVDAESGHRTVISPSRQVEQTAERWTELEVQVEPVMHATSGGPRARLAVIERLLGPVIDEGGCALVVCNTVPDAQQTHTWLHERYAERGLEADELQLLHARFPGDVREERTQEVTNGMGREGPRPPRRIIVATQVVEQSLDLDADVVISDLAPLALLLQRAGRCWRHETWWTRHGRPDDRERPVWAANGPRLVVLDPLADGGVVPKHWGEIYPEFLLTETSALLKKRGANRIVVPNDVQDLVEQVHGDREDRFDWGSPEQSAAWSAFTGENLAKQSIGSAVVIPRARRGMKLHNLHCEIGSEEEAATRLGADSVRLLCVYKHQDGSITLDLEGKTPMPPGADGRMETADVRAVMSRTIPVRADWFQDRTEAHRPPDAWAEHPMLGDLLVLEQLVCQGQVQPAQLGNKRMWLDPELGLVRE